MPDAAGAAIAHCPQNFQDTTAIPSESTPLRAYVFSRVFSGCRRSLTLPEWGAIAAAYQYVAAGIPAIGLLNQHLVAVTGPKLAEVPLTRLSFRRLVCVLRPTRRQKQ